jgi:hypothetical protein
MNTLEDRLRAALDAHAETFSASPDAWQRIGARRNRRGRTRRRALLITRRAPFLLPVAAAAAVVAVILGATTVGHGLAGTKPASTSRTPAPSATTRKPVPLLPGETGPAGQLLATDPPVSAIIEMTVTRNVKTWAWIGEQSPLYWNPYITTGPQACHWTTSVTTGEGSGDCWPMPTIGPAHPAFVISGDTVGIGHPVLSGVAEKDVTTVTAVFPDGQRFPGVIGTGRGFPVKAWSVTCPVVKGTKLIFGGAAGQTLGTLSTAAPAGPIVLDLPQPAHGGVTLFRYPASDGTPAGATTAYLVDGHVALFSPQYFGGAVSPAAVSNPPAVAGLADTFGVAGQWTTMKTANGKRIRVFKPDRYTVVKAFGYAHPNVARIVITLPDGGQVATSTFAAGWPGSDVRLWQVSIPSSAWGINSAQPRLIATGYNSAGAEVGRVNLAG